MSCIDHRYSELFLVEEGEVLGVFNFSTYEGIAKVERAAVGRKW